MCLFGYRKKLLRSQEELAMQVKLMAEKNAQLEEKLRAIENATATNKEVIVATITGTNTVLTDSIKTQLNLVTNHMGDIKTDINKNLAEIRENTEKSLKDVREDNEKQLTAMRNVVEEKLTNTLNERLSQTFTTINERLDAVNKGLGEMQALSNGVTDLRKVLSNIKTRGTWGEVSLQNILDEILTPEQYKTQANVTGKKNGEAVDFAIVLPGKKREDKVYLPIDVKFPTEDYQRLVDSSERGDKEAMKVASKGLENALKIQAKSIHDKYIDPPYTTDFAIMYLPVEGLYAEVVKYPGLMEEMRVKNKVIPAGPTTISALLNSLNMGFRTLAIQRSSKEVFDLLTAFKKDFNTFVEDLERAQNQVDTVSRTLAAATDRNRQIRKKLDRVDKISLPEVETEAIE